MGEGFGQTTFGPAEFRGVKIGKNRIEDVRKRFGAPKYVEEETGWTILHYDDIAAVPGPVEIIIRKRIVDSVYLRPRNLPLAEARKLFASEPRTVRYEFDVCLGDGESAPIYESPSGQFVYVLYSNLGVALQLKGDAVQEIIYRNAPPGARESVCNKRESKVKEMVSRV